jgi:hypothetical protein
MSGLRRVTYTNQDYAYLENLLSNEASSNNIYLNIDWNQELNVFWKSVKAIQDGTNPPLFAHALASHFYVEDVPKSSFEELFDSAAKFEVIKDMVNNLNINNFHKDTPKPSKPETSNTPIDLSNYKVPKPNSSRNLRSEYSSLNDRSKTSRFDVEEVKFH